MTPAGLLVFAPQRVACMKLMTLAIPAARAKARIDAFLARDPHAEFTRMHIVRSPRDIEAPQVPIFVADYLREMFAHRSVG